MTLAIRIALIFMLMGCGSKNGTSEVQASPKARIGNSAPDFTLPSTSGKKVSLSEFKGRVVLIDFWATWCPPCRYSTPAMVRLNHKMKDKDFTIIGVSVDDSMEDVLPYVRKENVKHVVVHDSSNRAGLSYGVRSIPAFFLLDKEGIIRKQYIGFSPTLEQEIEREALGLLAKKP